MSCLAKQSVAPAKDWNAAMKQEGMGSHWQLLDQEARTQFQEALEERSLAYRVIARHIRQLPCMRSMGHYDVVIYLIRRFLDQTRGQATVEDAAVYLARSSWDVLLASYRWIDPENYAAMAEDELWGDEKNDEADLLDIDEAIRPVVQNHPMTQQETRYPVEDETLDTTAGIRTPNSATSDKAIQTAVTTASPNTTASITNLDRSPGVWGQFRPDKFTVSLGPPDRKTYREWRFPQHKRKNFDWQNRDHLRSLNTWRSQIFRRMLGSSRPAPVSYHKDENDWVTEQFVLHQQRALEYGLEPNYNRMDWDSITKSFNERFEGQMLPDCENPRPPRTKNSIQTQRYRIVAVSELTGVPLKNRNRRRKKPAEPATSDTRPRKGTTAMGTDGSKTGKRKLSANTTNGGTTRDSNTPVRKKGILDEEEEELSDDATISEVENA